MMKHLMWHTHNVSNQQCHRLSHFANGHCLCTVSSVSTNRIRRNSGAIEALETAPEEGNMEVPSKKPRNKKGQKSLIFSLPYSTYVLMYQCIAGKKKGRNGKGSGSFAAEDPPADVADSKPGEIASLLTFRQLQIYIDLSLCMTVINKGRNAQQQASLPKEEDAADKSAESKPGECASFFISLEPQI